MDSSTRRVLLAGSLSVILLKSAFCSLLWIRFRWLLPDIMKAIGGSIKNPLIHTSPAAGWHFTHQQNICNSTSLTAIPAVNLQAGLVVCRDLTLLNAQSHLKRKKP